MGHSTAHMRAYAANPLNRIGLTLDKRDSADAAIANDITTRDLANNLHEILGFSDEELRARKSEFLPGFMALHRRLVKLGVV